MFGGSLWSFNGFHFCLAGVGKKWRTKKLLLEKLPITQHVRSMYARLKECTRNNCVHFLYKHDRKNCADNVKLCPEIFLHHINSA